MKVLITDDQQRSRQSVKALLDIWYPSNEVREAVNGIEAFNLIDEFMPDVILMDVRMPVMGGLEATRLIKAIWPQMRVIIFSMYPEYASDAMKAGADAFVCKGESPENLKRKIAEIL